MENTKTILFITEFMTPHWAFSSEIDKLTRKGFECIITDRLEEAKKLLEANAISKVVMFPLFMDSLDYPFAPVVIGPREEKFFTGYFFYKQELAGKNIPVVLVNIYGDSEGYIHQAMMANKEEDWKDDPKVIFFNDGHSYENDIEKELELVAIIAS